MSEERGGGNEGDGGREGEKGREGGRRVIEWGEGMREMEGGWEEGTYILLVGGREGGRE